ncbi:MAG: fluoride efflux transporter CrcB [Pseudonocardiaceae bacterium]
MAPVDPDVDLHLQVDRAETRTRRWDLLLAIAIGGALGSEARYGLSVALPPTAGAMPWATLLVNVSGCVLIGVLMVTITELTTPHRLVRPLLGVGVLGGYTTFSTYSLDIQQMLTAGRPGLALIYLAVTPLAALAAVWIGANATRLLAGPRLHGGP